MSMNNTNSRGCQPEEKQVYKDMLHEDDFKEPKEIASSLKVAQGFSNFLKHFFK